MSATFKKFKEAMIAHIDDMFAKFDSTREAVLFRTNIPYEDMWNTYLESFTDEENPIFRVRREHDCSCCRHFVRDFGDAVICKDGVLESIWDIQNAPAPYDKACTAMSKLVKGKIHDIFWSRSQKIGTDHNVEQLDVPMNIDGRVVTTITWDHFSYNLLSDFYAKFKGRSKGDYCGDFESMAMVLKRSVDEITEESVTTILDLIKDNALYRGNEWANQLDRFLTIKRHYSELRESDEIRAWNYIWESAAKWGPVISKIRNHSIGTLLVDLSEGMDLEKAVSRYEQIVAPTNYKRPKELYTKKMLEDAKAELSDLGYIESLQRRYAVRDDIPIDSAFYYNASANASANAETDIFDQMMSETTTDPKKFKNAPSMTFEEFKNGILPTAESIEVFIENRHSRNMMSLIAPETNGSKSMFKWNNAISWCYSGNITDSNIKENVKTAGGNVDCDVRFSIQWNDTASDRVNNNDLDAHAIEHIGGYGSYEIYYGRARIPSPRKGVLDVDIRYPRMGTPAVENIVYPDIKRLANTSVTFFVHCYERRPGNQDGFKAELCILGENYEFNYTGDLRTGQRVDVAHITFDTNAKPTVKLLLPESNRTSRSVWGLNTNRFYPVSMILPSPNYWETNVGNEHTFFIIPGAKNDETPNAFYNEFLDERLNKYKRFMAALGGKLKIADSDHQLSGIGFSSTIRNSVVVRVNGGKVINVTF